MQLPSELRSRGAPGDWRSFIHSRERYARRVFGLLVRTLERSSRTMRERSSIGTLLAIKARLAALTQLQAVLNEAIAVAEKDLTTVARGGASTVPYRWPTNETGSGYSPGSGLDDI